MSLKTYLLFLVIFTLDTQWLIKGIQTTCIHDKIQHVSDVPRQYVRYSDYNSNSGRLKRSHNGRFWNIRIHVEMMELDELSIAEKSQLQTIVQKTVNKASGILSVLPVQDRLLLKRSGCNSVWQDGINVKKCAQVKDGYSGESCPDNPDNFQIPDKHLEGLLLYNNTHQIPIREVFPAGAGVQNADFILYIRAISTSACIQDGDNVIAYASYCQVDQRSRPIAGYINFCPQFIHEHGFTEEGRIEVTSLHELFHALGFTRKLFQEFRNCAGQLCGKQTNPVRQAQGALRLVTPKAVQLTSAHFGCTTQFSDNEFGPMLQTENQMAKSHWDAAFMQGSIMAPSVGLPHQTFVDPITLAAFEDSGWYTVDYSHADPFLWGKGGGCNFALPVSCHKKSQYFCEGSSSGCHFLHQDKATCDSSKFLNGCRTFKSRPEDNCQTPENQPELGSLGGDMYGEDSRCFVSNLTISLQTPKSSRMSGPLSGVRCYQHRCEEGQLQVRVSNTTWVDCLPNKWIEVPGFDGSLQCPPDGILCVPRIVTEQPMSEPEPEMTAMPPSDEATNEICIEIHFKSADYQVLWQRQLLQKFRDTLVEHVCSVTGIKRTRMTQIQVFEGSVIFSFNLGPPQSAEEGPPSDLVYERLMELINAGNFSIRLPPDNSAYSASTVRRMEPGPELLPTALPAGVIAGVVVGSALAAGIIGTLLFFVQRYYTTTAHSDSRLQLHTHHNASSSAVPYPDPNLQNHELPSSQRDRDPHPRSGNQTRPQHRSRDHFGRIHLPPGYWDRHRHGRNHGNRFQHSNFHGNNYGERHSNHSNYSERLSGYSNYSDRPGSLYSSVYGGSSSASVFEASRSERSARGSYPPTQQSVASVDIVLADLDQDSLDEDEEEIGEQKFSQPV